MTTAQNTTSPGEYYAAKIAESKWGIFFINAAFGNSQQFGSRTYKTQREARRTAAEYNWAAREIAKEQS